MMEIIPRVLVSMALKLSAFQGSDIVLNATDHGEDVMVLELAFTGESHIHIFLLLFMHTSKYDILIDMIPHIGWYELFYL